MTRRRSPWVFTAASALLALLWAPAPTAQGVLGAPTAQASQGESLWHVAGPSTLALRYGLGVVEEVPELPAELRIAAAPEATLRACPIEVRAIIQGDDDAFAMIGVDGDSRLLRVGDGTKTDAGWVSVTAIDADAIRIRDRLGALRCPLRSE